MTEGVSMNKYHFDDTYKIDPGTKNAWKVQRVNHNKPSGTETIFLPKSECEAEQFPNGKVILNIPTWLIDKYMLFFDRA